MEQVFENINAFLDYIEFCPLCHKKTTSYTSKYLSGQEVAISGDYSDLIANIYDNQARVIPFSNAIINDTNLRFTIDKRCSKYHFYYRANINVNTTSSIIETISLSRIHLIIQSDGTHFALNTYFDTNITSVRITTSGAKTKELILPAFEIDLSSKKRIINRLLHIEVLM